MKKAVYIFFVLAICATVALALESVYSDNNTLSILGGMLGTIMAYGSLLLLSGRPSGIYIITFTSALLTGYFFYMIMYGLGHEPWQRLLNVLMLAFSVLGLALALTLRPAAGGSYSALRKSSE